LPTASVLQKEYLSATGTQLYLGQNGRAKWSVFLTPILALLLLATECLTSSAKEKYWELGFYWYIDTVILLHVVWWWFVCSSLRAAMFGISENFFKVLKLPYLLLRQYLSDAFSKKSCKIAHNSFAIKV
jgi:hypothetical protein